MKCVTAELATSDGHVHLRAVSESIRPTVSLCNHSDSLWCFHRCVCITVWYSESKENDLIISDCQTSPSSQAQVDENKVEEVRLRPVVVAAKRKMPVTEGVVEVKYKDGWAQICDVGWTIKNTRVVCGMLGFPHERKVNKNFYKWVNGSTLIH